MQTATTFQYASDLHLEFYDKHNKGAIDFRQWIEPAAPYLLLAGDIGQPHRPSYHVFLRQAAANFDRIYLIAGNHEFYHKKESVETIKENIRSGLPANVEFLDTSLTTTPTGVRILGTTLWSDIKQSEWYEAATFLNDFHQIQSYDMSPWTPMTYIVKHAHERYWLETELENQPTIPTLVMTHHLPSYNCIAEKYNISPMNSCFASNLDDLFASPVKSWVCGHTHSPLITTVNNIPVYINPTGYPGEHRQYNRKATFEFNPLI